ncbi:L,D-transpeptidase family protein [Photobacterium angustum]|uniref:L,D-transpeptidase family protein n=1 Tax=Photobacterium angustum TaxID=661 RepID=UPI0005DE51BF|nr:L,D-transpeptidase family protein [Photobacterium angustum]KJG25390.1 peptidoglycan-binding protein [Photobacterium angustum]KJG33703.1 peptidoglycan-binding protein [Photobacterium angustum]PSW95881.1 L,D-transpeptidase [Photobacterium angustum]PSX02231.1 L,D-transpeptidase [Photobacterium angustum]PSX38041.1 L,D-transpeptidase [Photobacterium angustum]
MTICKYWYFTSVLCLFSINLTASSDLPSHSETENKTIVIKDKQIITSELMNSSDEEIFSNNHTVSQQYQIAKGWVKDIANNVQGIQYIDKLAELYLTIGYGQVWQDQIAMSEFEEQLYVLSLTRISPDLTRRYHNLKRYRNNSDWRDYDVLATDTLFAYMGLIEGIQKKGNLWLFGDIPPTILPLPSDGFIEKLLRSHEQQRLRYFIARLKPLDNEYTELVTALYKLNLIKDTRWPIFLFKGNIQPGQYVKNIEGVVTVLETLGDMTALEAENARSQKIQDLSGSVLIAVKRFQERHGLKSDGVIGPQTQQWLALNIKERIRLLALNAQRMRLWSVKPDTGIVVNIPSYYMNLWLEGEKVLGSKVIVGRPSRQTPMIYSDIQSVVFNPYWNVPNSIMKKDIMPKVRRNRNYLANHNYEVIKGWDNGQKIAINSIPYHLLSPNRFPYRLRQKPGKRNALGLYKFNFPNNQAIYLHDTASRSLFKKHERALSSGCIRVEQAKSLAKVLLEYSGSSEQRFDNLSRSRKTRTIVLGDNKSVPVDLIYQTAWVDDLGLVHYRSDIYQYDRDQRKNSSLISAYNY